MKKFIKKHKKVLLVSGAMSLVGIACLTVGIKMENKRTDVNLLHIGDTGEQLHKIVNGFEYTDIVTKEKIK